MHSRHALVEAHGNLVLQEIRNMAQQKRDEITVKTGWFIRSDAQLRRYAKAKLQGDHHGQNGRTRA